MMILGAAYIAANIFWLVLFSPWTAGWVNFWTGMAAFSGTLALVALAVSSQRRKLFAFTPAHLWIGALSAALLYLVFFFGHKLSVWVLPGAQSEISRIYLTRAQLPAWQIALLLAFLIAPAEEIFWRGFVQETLARRFGSWAGYAAATAAYAMVHVYAFNLMLFTAALVCGAFWGYLYQRQGSLWPVIISHAIWDVTIFVLLPVR